MYKDFLALSKDNLRARLFLIYVTISIVAIIQYTLVFLFVGLLGATLIQVLFLIPFVLSLFVYFKFKRRMGILLAIMGSILIVTIQTFGYFSNQSGFHYQLFPLIIVIYLVCDMKQIEDKILSNALSLLTATAFVLCLQFAEKAWFPLTGITEYGVFRNIALIICLIATMIMLYVYSNQLSMGEKRLEYLANHDTLTGLYNRRFYNKQGQSLWASKDQDKKHISVMLIDLDDFKHINDTYGHAAGDKALISFSDITSANLPTDAIFARYGGEEFAILLPTLALEKAYEVAESVRIAIEKSTLIYDNQKITYTISIGLTSFAQGHQTFDEVMTYADKMLYASKNSGKNQTSYKI